MKTESEQFAGWQVDRQMDEAFAPKSVVTLAHAAFIASLVIAVGLWLAQYVTAHDLSKAVAILVCLAGIALVTEQYARRRSIVTATRCRHCSNEMTTIETLVDRNSPQCGDVIFGTSGHAYRLVAQKGGIDVVYEVRHQWRACEGCRRYFLAAPEHLIDIGRGRSAIDDQEATYARNAQTILRLERHAHGRKEKLSRP
jgi:hypothetical protein